MGQEGKVETVPAFRWRRIWRRGRVLLIAYASVMLLSMLFAARLARRWSPDVVLWALSASHQGALFPMQDIPKHAARYGTRSFIELIIVTLVMIGMILAHPLYPRRWTAVITCLGVLIWAFVPYGQL